MYTIRQTLNTTDKYGVGYTAQGFHLTSNRDFYVVVTVKLYNMSVRLSVVVSVSSLDTESVHVLSENGMPIVHMHKILRICV